MFIWISVTTSLLRERGVFVLQPDRLFTHAPWSGLDEYEGCSNGYAPRLMSTDESRNGFFEFGLWIDLLFGIARLSMAKATQMSPSLSRWIEGARPKRIDRTIEVAWCWAPGGF